MDLKPMIVKASLVSKNYEKDEKISDSEMELLSLNMHKTLPKWNYTLKPFKM
jgi:hypothetical protein